MQRHSFGIGILLAGIIMTGLFPGVVKAEAGDNGAGASPGAPVAPSVAVTPGDGWHFFTFPNVIGGAGSDHLSYTSTGATVITVTDAFCVGDEFHVYDNSVLLGDTSPVASESPACSDVPDPDAAIAAGFSNGTFKVCSAGAHDITVTVKELWSAGSGGGAFFRVDNAICSVADACAAGGIAVDAACPPTGVYKNHGAYVSCVAAATNAYLATLTGFTTDELAEISSCIVNPRARTTVGK